MLPEDPDSGDQTPALQRLLGRRRRHRRSRLRELRHARRLRAASRSSASSVKGKIVLARYGARLARHQAEGRLRARRHRLPHLLRSARTMATSRATCIPTGPYRPEHGVQRGSVMDMPVHPGDPLTPGWGSEAGGKKLPREDVADDPEDPGAADFVRRRAADAASNSRDRSRPQEWRGALPVTYHVGPRPGAGAPEAGVRLEEPPALQRRSSRIPGHDAARTSGSSSAITTTRG